MTSIRFSNSGTVTATGTFTIALGGTPNLGDQIVVWLGVSNEIVTHQPNYNNPTQWFQMGALRSRNTSTLSAYQHTWTASDSGTSVVFSVSPAPSLGIGDKDLSSAKIVWVTATLAGPTGASESAVQGSYDASGVVIPGPLKKGHSVALVASYGLLASSFTDSDSGSSLIQNISDGSQALSVFSVATPVAGYSATLTANLNTVDVLSHTSTFNDNPPFIYQAPIIYEGPVAEDPLLYRYTLARYYTVLNNSGTFSAQRYNSTDQLNAATQVFTNNSPISSTDRTNLLNAGIGGEFASA